MSSTSVAGFDYSVSHFHLTDTLGRFEFSTVWSMYTHYRIATESGGNFNQVVNQPTPEGSGSDNGYLRWKGRVQVGWVHKGFAMLLGASLQLTNAYGDTFLHDFAKMGAYKDLVAVRYPAIIMSISQISETLFILAIPFFLRRFGIKTVMLISMFASSTGSPGASCPNAWPSRTIAATMPRHSP